jgi:2',3'-cyclic-nucleotide 2'-phosphodiesterase
MKILFIGEIVGKRGLKVVADLLPELKNQEQIDFVVANGNKIDNGFSVVESDADELQAAGVDVITLGDNCFKKKVTVDYLDSAHSVIRPLNSFYGNPGKGFIVTSTQDGIPVCVISVFGRTNFKNPVLDNPFHTVKRALKQIADETKVIIIDFHANATSEKLCMGSYLSGRVSAVIGTHFSAQTSDLHVDNNGTAYITDIGMVGGKNSICGYQPQQIIDSYLTGLFPRKKVMETDYIFNSVIMEVNPEDGAALSAILHNREID